MEWKERWPLNMIRFPVCMLFRMPMPAGYWGIRWENFFPSKLKTRKRDLKAISALKLFLTWCFTIKIQRLTKNDFSTRSRSETQTPYWSLLVAKLLQSECKASGADSGVPIRQTKTMRSLYITVYTKPYFPPWCPWAARGSGSASL